ncbi:MFS transporter [Nakamurella endophytica]|uniref:MFS transporter n=1 Tax=Nakamurella endophytica TaxID=1748367 RepID=A0A917STB0_9ACTN|nr:MFS transporter [Nakamurella endophytica]GGL96676.1 MFS transporter [Nakamurella endophytica]
MTASRVPTEQPGVPVPAPSAPGISSPGAPSPVAPSGWADAAAEAGSAVPAFDAVDAEPEAPGRQPIAVWVLAFAAMVSFMGIGLVDPILKSIAANFDATPSQVSLLFTSYLLVTSIAMLVTSFFSSRLGGRTTLIIGLCVIIVFASLAGTSPSVAALVGWRAGWGLGNALFIATALAAIIAVARGGASKAITLYEAALGIGISLGPLVGAVLGDLNFRLPFFGVGVLMALALLAILFLLKDRVTVAHSIRPADPLRALSHGGLLFTGLAALLYNGGFFAVLAYVPFVLPYGAYGIGGMFFGWGVLLGICAVWVAPWLRRRIGLPAAFGAALGLFAVLLVAVALSVAHPTAVTVLVIACGAPLGVLNTLFTETAMNVSPVPRPVASAGYNFIRFLGGAVSPYVCGKLGESIGHAAPFWFGGICVAVGLVVLLGPARRHLSRIAAAH